MYPIFMNVENRNCTVVGGGKVALRKIKSLLSQKAIVTVISPQIIPEVLALPITIINQKYHSKLIEDSFLIITATDDKNINSLVVADAKKKGILVSSATDSKNSDFILPATTSCGDIEFAVSTNGNFPKLAIKICHQLDKDYNMYSEICTILGKYRMYIIKNVTDQYKKQSLLNAMVSEETLSIALEKDVKTFEKRIIEIINKGE